MSKPDPLPAPANADANARVPHHTRYGLILFAIYLVFYGGFVLLNAFAPALMARPFLAGINLAVWYGMALIIGALVLALIYAWFCREREASR